MATYEAAAVIQVETVNHLSKDGRGAHAVTTSVMESILLKSSLMQEIRKEHWTTPMSRKLEKLLCTYITMVQDAE